MFRNIVTALALATAATASPLVTREEPTSVLPSGPDASETPAAVYDWSADWKTKFPIHESCNATLRAQLEDALDETQQLAQHARDHLLKFGHKSEFVQKYFGNSSTATPAGWFDRVVAADKTGMVFRCDDPDKNCATQDEWAGHWRGENATSETVICDLSFHIRKPLSAVCGLGYTVANSKLNTYWATDLLHRVLHVPEISEGIVDHYAEDYNDALRQAEEEPEKSAIDSDVLQYFAIDVWAYDIAAPGVGCTGEQEETEEETETPTSTVSSAPSSTSSASQECHTHDDGVVHCS